MNSNLLPPAKSKKKGKFGTLTFYDNNREGKLSIQTGKLSIKISLASHHACAEGLGK